MIITMQCLVHYLDQACCRSRVQWNQWNQWFASSLEHSGAQRGLEQITGTSKCGMYPEVTGFHMILWISMAALNPEFIWFCWFLWQFWMVRMKVETMRFCGCEMSDNPIWGIEKVVAYWSIDRLSGILTVTWNPGVHGYCGWFTWAWNLSGFWVWNFDQPPKTPLCKADLEKPPVRAPSKVWPRTMLDCLKKGDSCTHWPTL